MKSTRRSAVRRTPQRTRRAQSSQSSLLGTLFRGGVETLRNQAGEQASHLTQFLREQGDRFLQERKTRAAEELATVGQAVRVAADQLRDQQATTVGDYVETAAEGIDRVSQLIQERDLADLGREIEDFARRQPAVVLGGLLVTGLVIGRFVKAGLSSSPARNRTNGRGRNR